MLVSGELAGAPELYESLARELGLNASLLISPLKCVRRIDASNYLVNVGLTLKELALKGARPLSPNCNTLPAPYLPKHVSLKQLLALPAAALAVVLIGMMAISAQNTAADVDSLKTQVLTNNITLEKKLAQKKVLLKNIDNLQKEISGLEAEYAAYDKAYIEMNRTGDLMNTDLATTIASLADGLSLTSLSHSSGQININGSAISEQAILGYVKKLQDTGRFDEITITSISRIEPENGDVYQQFALKCYLKDGRP
jgi:Tfp pilus assembly protein PilN